MRDDTQSQEVNSTMRSVDAIAPFRIDPFYSPRPWGSRDLRPWVELHDLSEPIGEAWLTGPESRVATGKFAGKTIAALLEEEGRALLGGSAGETTDFPLLIKMLFPKEKLSVQVHPDDAFAQRMGEPRGKTECWYVLQAEEGAAVALGFRERHSVADIEAAIKATTLEELLDWVPVTVGDMIFVDAGTVHAIGPGVVLLEVQQQSDLTYRLFDYGRDRELHLDRGLEAMRMQTAAGKVQATEIGKHRQLISTNYFEVNRIDLGSGESGGEDLQRPGIAQAIFAVNGSGFIEAEGCEPVSLQRGQLAVIPASSPVWRLRAQSPLQAVSASQPLPADVATGART
jgi:mannose-6-phosphate isomerase